MNTKQVNDDVYGLIAGMTASERAFYQKVAKGRALQPPPLHLRLFDVISDGNVDNDGEAKAAMRITNSAQFSNLKNYLGAELLDTITFCNRDQSPQICHYFGLIQLEVLLERCNFHLARRYYKKLWIHAEEKGQFAWAVQLLQFRERMLNAEATKRSIAEMTDLEATIQQYINYRQTDSLLEQLAERLNRLKAETPLRFLPAQRMAVEAILEELLPARTAAQSTTHLQFRFLTVLCEATYLLHDFDTCSGYILEVTELLQASPELIPANSVQFLSVSGTSFYNAFAAGRVQEAVELLEIFTSQAQPLQSDPVLGKQWAIIAFNTALKIANKTANYMEVRTLLYGRELIIAHALDVLKPVDAISVMTSIAISLFVLDEFDAAEHLILDIKEMNRSLNREDMLYFSMIFHLLILYEQKAWYRLDNATEAAYHLLYSKNKLRPFEKELMRFLKHLPAYRGKVTTTPAIRTFLERLETFRSDPLQRLYFLYFNYYDWLQSKLAGLPYRDYKRQLLANEDQKAD